MSLAPVQISASMNFNGTLSAQVTLSGVTAGNTILVAVAHGDRSGNSPTIAVSDSQGTYAIDVQQTNGGVSRAQICKLANANAGTHTITATASGGTAAQSVGRIIAYEVSPCTLDRSNGGGANSGTAVNIGATAGLATAADLVIGALYFDSMSLGGGTFPPTGGTGTYTEDVAHLDQSDIVHQLLTSNAGVGANWGTFTTASKWSAVVGAYQPATIVPIAPMALGGMVVQVCQ